MLYSFFFLSLLSNLRGASIESDHEDLANQFDEFDLDGNGFIDAEEILRSSGGRVPLQQLWAFFGSKVDKNQDALVSEEEFYDFALSIDHVD